ncbi:MAG: DUF4345 domain-containing protein [Flavobacterium sp.]|nr:DUF4345 domain-containing protein [Flavobacterium sp.]
MNFKITKQNIQLLISIIIVIPVAIQYGFKPNFQFELYPKTTDEHNFFKAIMGLYLGFALVWIIGIVKETYLKLALVTNLVFMLGLGFGRILSLFLDGLPTSGYVYGTIGELVLGFYSLYVLVNKKGKQ